MAKKSPQPKVIPVITGIHKQGEKKIIALHNHPKAITHFLRNFIGNVHDDAPDALTAAVEKEILSGNTKPYTQLRRGIKRRN